MNNIPTHKHHHHEMPTLPFIGANSTGKYVADYPVEDPFDDHLPDCSSFLKDVIVQKKTTDESYQPRRIVITESRLYFAHLDDKRVLDDIPLHEILEVSQRHNTKTLNASSNHHADKRQDSILTWTQFLMSWKEAASKEVDWGGDELCVTTAVEGHNSGRQYYLKCEDGRACRELVDFLERIAKASIKREVPGGASGQRGSQSRAPDTRARECAVPGLCNASYQRHTCAGAGGHGQRRGPWRKRG